VTSKEWKFGLSTLKAFAVFVLATMGGGKQEIEIVCVLLLRSLASLLLLGAC